MNVNLIFKSHMFVIELYDYLLPLFRICYICGGVFHLIISVH